MSLPPILEHSRNRKCKRNANAMENQRPPLPTSAGGTVPINADLFCSTTNASDLDK